MKVPYNLQTTIPERDVGVNSQSGNAVIALPFPNPHNIAAKRGNVSLFRDQFFSNTISLKIIPKLHNHMQIATHRTNSCRNGIVQTVTNRDAPQLQKRTNSSVTDLDLLTDTPCLPV
jgi:hypothetical protein